MPSVFPTISQKQDKNNSLASLKLNKCKIRAGDKITALYIGNPITDNYPTDNWYNLLTLSNNLAICTCKTPATNGILLEYGDGDGEVKDLDIANLEDFDTTRADRIYLGQYGNRHNQDNIKSQKDCIIYFTKPLTVTLALTSNSHFDEDFQGTVAFTNTGRVNTGTFDPASNNPAGQKSIAEYSVAKVDLDKFTEAFYENCDVALYMNCTIHSYTALLSWNNYLAVPYKDKITSLNSFCENASMVGPVDDDPKPVIVPDIPNEVEAEAMFFNARCKSITLGNITMRNSNYAFSKLKGTKSVVVSSGKKAKIVGNIREGFSRNSSLVEIGAFDFSEVTDAYYAFGEDYSLKSIHCTHFRVSFDISFSTAFEQADLIEIISNLDPVSTTQTLTMGATNLAKLTQEQILVATGKGWTLA